MHCRVVWDAGFPTPLCILHGWFIMCSKVYGGRIGPCGLSVVFCLRLPPAAPGSSCCCTTATCRLLYWASGSSSFLLLKPVLLLLLLLLLLLKLLLGVLLLLRCISRLSRRLGP